MIIFLYGEDSYRSRQKLNEIIEHYKTIHKSGLNFKLIDFQEPMASVKDLKDGLRQSSMFKEKKMVVATNIFSDKMAQEELLGMLKDLEKSEDIIVLYQNSKIDLRSALLKALEKTAKTQKFDLLTGVKLKNWINEQFTKYNAKADNLVAEKLINFVGNDLWQMANEIEKLANYKNGKIIKLEDIDLLVKPKIETDIFATIDAIAKKDKKQALKLLHRHIEKGDNALYLLSMINFQFRNLLIIKDLSEKYQDSRIIAKKSGLHPFVVQKSFYQAKAFTLADLKKIYQKIFQLDLEIKTGKIEPEIALDLFIAGI